MFLVSQHQQQVAAAVERAKQVTMQELNAIIGVSVAVGLLEVDLGSKTLGPEVGSGPAL